MLSVVVPHGVRHRVGKVDGTGAPPRVVQAFHLRGGTVAYAIADEKVLFGLAVVYPLQPRERHCGSPVCGSARACILGHAGWPCACVRLVLITTSYRIRLRASHRALLATFQSKVADSLLEGMRPEERRVSYGDPLKRMITSL